MPAYRNCLRSVFRELRRSRTFCRTLDYLLLHTGCSPEQLLKALRQLTSMRIIARKQSDRTETYCLRMTQPATKVALLVDELRKPNTAAQISGTTDLRRGNVSQICRRLHEKGLIEKGPAEYKRLFYVPLIRSVLHSGNYEIVARHNRTLRSTLKRFKEINPRLIADIKRAFARHPEVLAEILNVISQSSTVSEVREKLAMRPFEVKANTWKRA